MKKTKYRKLLSEELIRKSPFPEVTTPAMYYQGDWAGDDLTFDWNCVSKPFALENVPRKADHDQFIVFMGTNLDDFEDFGGAEIELVMGEEKTKQVITQPRLVYIPAGLTYGPINFKTIKAPVAYMNFWVAPAYAKGWKGGSYEKLIVNPMFLVGTLETKTFTDGQPFREGSVPTLRMVVVGDNIGPEGANFCVFFYSIRYPYYLTEPSHAHNLDMWIINVGGNPMNVEEFDAEVEMWWGDEGEKIVLDTPSVAHVPPGLVHRSLFFSPVNKPFIQIHTYTRNLPEKDVIVQEKAGMNLAPGRVG